jgi:hypothetical protein
MGISHHLKSALNSSLVYVLSLRHADKTLERYKEVTRTEIRDFCQVLRTDSVCQIRLDVGDNKLRLPGREPSSCRAEPCARDVLLVHT